MLSPLFSFLMSFPFKNKEPLKIIISMQNKQFISVFLYESEQVDLVPCVVNIHANFSRLPCWSICNNILSYNPESKEIFSIN